MRTLTVLVNAHISHLTVEQTIRSSDLATLLDDAITTVVPDGSEDGFTDVGGRAMMAMRVRASGSGQGEEDNSDAERPSMVLRRQDGDAEEDVPDYQPPLAFQSR